MKGSNYGLESPREAWHERARCAVGDVDRDWWHADGATQLGVARHVCLAHCPVLAQCAAYVQRLDVNSRRSVVYAGVVYNRLGNASEWQPDATGCPACGVVEDPKERLRRKWREDTRRQRARQRQAVAA